MSASRRSISASHSASTTSGSSDGSSELLMSRQISGRKVNRGHPGRSEPRCRRSRTSEGDAVAAVCCRRRQDLFHAQASAAWIRLLDHNRSKQSDPTGDTRLQDESDISRRSAFGVLWFRHSGSPPRSERLAMSRLIWQIQPHDAGEGELSRPALMADQDNKRPFSTHKVPNGLIAGYGLMLPNCYRT